MGILIHFSLSLSTRMNAFREIKPVELPNCKLVKGIGKCLRRGSISLEFSVLSYDFFDYYTCLILFKNKTVNQENVIKLFSSWL